jgi:hypothetical protein
MEPHIVPSIPVKYGIDTNIPKTTFAIVAVNSWGYPCKRFVPSRRKSFSKHAHLPIIVLS